MPEMLTSLFLWHVFWAKPKVDIIFRFSGGGFFEKIVEEDNWRRESIFYVDNHYLAS